MMNVYHRRPPMAQRITDAAAAADPLLIRWSDLIWSECHDRQTDRQADMQADR
jgi:hypothetical protein